MPYHAPFTRNLTWNSLMTFKYRQGRRQSYHLKAVVWFLISNFSFCERIVYNLRHSGRWNRVVSPEISGNFLRKIFGNFLRKISWNFRKYIPIFPEISGKFPKILIPENFRKFLLKYSTNLPNNCIFDYTSTFYWLLQHLCALIVTLKHCFRD